MKIADSQFSTILPYLSIIGSNQELKRLTQGNVSVHFYSTAYSQSSKQGSTSHRFRWFALLLVAFLLALLSGFENLWLCGQRGFLAFQIGCFLARVALWLLKSVAFWLVLLFSLKPLWLFGCWFLFGFQVVIAFQPLWLCCFNLPWLYGFFALLLGKAKKQQKPKNYTYEKTKKQQKPKRHHLEKPKSYNQTEDTQKIRHEKANESQTLAFSDQKLVKHSLFRSVQ